MQQRDGTIGQLVQGSYLGQLDRPGFVTSTLYEVTASFVPAPEPGVLMGIEVVGMVAIGRWRR